MTDDVIEGHERRIGENARDVAHLKQELRDLRETVERLEEIVDTSPESLAYDQMDREDKAQVVRSHLYDAAAGRRASMKYGEVQALFGGRPSPGHAYDIMDQAANADGFEYDENRAGEKRIRVDTDAVNADADFHGANKATSGEAA